ncbi:acetyl-CoA carboxylase carboxyl transferase subunit alpha [Caldalkalibacillus salinus]|uniref:acetyl-CoA carboxylase carboxyl transferase subunit alpha n=1 Tax=Caldalkalibacillus salinus TaxID=2803787 RepID=UPI0019208A3A|nr:acetyl-CoA carboxylase carboxyl transferase subunit alpha [Caldalkalibacillus salinus]
MAGDLSFERPLVELRNKIEELQQFTDEKDIDFTEEINRLEEKARNLAKEIYGNLTPMQRIQIARHPQRPTTLDYIEQIFDSFVEVHGDRLHGDDRAIITGICKLGDQPVTVIGHQKGKDTKDNIARNFGMPHPEGYRKALRAMEQANKFKRPIVTFIDTPGAFPGIAAEERGQSEAIARNLREMAGFEVPIICIVIGEGGSGGALAISIGNHIYMLENAVYSTISPEGAAAIIWKDASQAQRAAEAMRITAGDLLEMGVIEGVIPEPQGGAHHNLEQQAQSIKSYIQSALDELNDLSQLELVTSRYEKFKKIGEISDVSDYNMQV